MASVGTGRMPGSTRARTWNNPEPEVVLAVASTGRIVGATLGNDVNLRDVEGRSALLLSKAKDNNASCAIGPCCASSTARSRSTTCAASTVTLTVEGPDGFRLEGSSSIARISRDPEDLVAQMIGPNHQYPDGAVLFLGTMFAPVEDRDAPGKGFTHKVGDIVTIAAPQLGAPRQPDAARARLRAVDVRDRRADAQPRTTRPFVTALAPDSPRSGGWSTRTQLAAFALALSAPILAFVGLLLWQVAAAERARVEADGLARAHNMAVALDRELTGLITTLEVLSTSADLRRNDLEGFHRRIADLRERQGLIVLLRDLSGQQLLNARRPYGTPLPKEPLEADATVLATKRPYVSDVVVGAVAQVPLFTIEAPVLRDGEVAWFLNLSLPLERIRDLIVSEDVPPGWIAAVVDRKGVILGRNVRHEEFAGRPASAALLGNATGAEGVYDGRTLEGVPVLSSYSRSRLTGWRVVLGVGRDELNAALRRSLWWFAGLGGGILVLSTLLALFFGRRIAAPIAALAGQARALGRGEPVWPLHGSSREVNRVSEVWPRRASGSRRARPSCAGARRATASSSRTRPITRSSPWTSPAGSPAGTPARSTCSAGAGRRSSARAPTASSCRKTAGRACRKPRWARR